MISIAHCKSSQWEGIQTVTAIMIDSYAWESSLVESCVCLFLTKISLIHVSPPFHADPNAHMPFLMHLKEREFMRCREENRCPMTGLSALRNTPCTDGKAGEYECSNVDLLSFVPLNDLGCSGDGNDIWGWTDPDTKKEYAIAGCADGTSFVDVTDPTDPKVLGFVRTHTFSSSWRDIKVILGRGCKISYHQN